MSATYHAPLTRYDYSRLPDDAPRQQLIEGFLVEEPSPSCSHQRAVGLIHFFLLGHVRQHPLGDVFVAPFDVFLNDINVFQPDVCFITKENLNRITEHGIEGSPDLVVETLSPSTARYDLNQKLNVYARTGVQELWMVDPRNRTITLYRFAVGKEPVTVLRDGDMLSTGLIPGLEMSVTEIFLYGR